MNLKSMKINQKLFFAFGVIIIFMLAVLAKTFINFIKASDVVDTNISAYEILRESDGIYNSLINVETGIRGYTITKDIRFLKPVNEGIKGFQVHYESISTLLSQKQEQLERLKKLKEEYESWLIFETEVLEQSSADSLIENDILNGYPDYVLGVPADNKMEKTSNYKFNSTDRIRSGKGREKMEGMQSILNEIAKEEERQLSIERSNLNKIVSGTYKTILVGGGYAIILAVFISFFISISITKPIKMLITATENITRQNYQQPIKMKADTDLNALIKNFNAMQVAIQIREDELGRKNQELKLKMAEGNEANRLKSQFLANVSHELRTPLNSIIGFTSRVIRKSEDRLPSTQLENLKIVKEEAYHLLELINNILDYSKLDAGKMTLHIETFDLNEVIEEVNSMINALVNEKKLIYKYEPFSKENIIITSDRIKIKQILINLLSNAIKYSEKGTINLSVVKSDNSYCMKLEDEGIGIPTADINNIFDEFRQVDGSYTRKVGGTGLGLSITKKFVEMLNGRIDVISTLGEGSCFSVCLPINLHSEM